MKNNKMTWLIWMISLAVFFGAQRLACASPIFPPSDNEPITKSAEKKDAPAEPVQQNTSTENANLHKGNSYGLAQIDVKILFGKSENGEKSYKTTYQLTEVAGNESSLTKKEPRVNVTFKKKSDQDSFAVAEVFVKKMANNAYKISAKIIEIEAGEVITPKVTWVD